MELTVTIMMIPPHRVYRWFRLPTEDSRMKAAISPPGITMAAIGGESPRTR